MTIWKKIQNDQRKTDMLNDEKLIPSNIAEALTPTVVLKFSL